MNFSLLVLLVCALGLSIATDLEECQNSFEDFKTRLASYGHYQPPTEPTKKPNSGMDANMGGMGDDEMMDDMDGMETDDMDGGMMDDEMMDDDDMMKKKRQEATSDGSAAPTNCYFFNTTTNMVYINCKVYSCIDTITDLIHEYDTSFVEECPMAEGFAVDAETKLIMEALRKFPGCNRCVVSYNEFSKLKAQIVAEGCWTTETFYSCDPKCVALNAEYKAQYDYMIRERVCRKMSMGYKKRDDCNGCELTEGQITVLLKKMDSDMSRIITSQMLCNEACPAPVNEWYSSWKTTAQNGCLETVGIDLATQDPILRIFTVKAQCNHECHDKVQSLISASLSIPNECRVGLVSDNLSGLVNSLNMKFCGEEEESETGSFEDMSAGRLVLYGVLGFVVAAILVVCCVVIANYVRGRRGWDLFLIRGKTAIYKEVDTNSLTNVGPGDEQHIAL